MVLVHGESYSWGAGHLMDGAMLAEKSRMVVVTLNYRLGILGIQSSQCDAIRTVFLLIPKTLAAHWLTAPSLMITAQNPLVEERYCISYDVCSFTSSKSQC